jgi:hypothetical protein
MTEKASISSTTLNLIVYETIKYIKSKNISNREKILQIEEFGLKIGDKIVNYLLNSLGGKTKMEEEEIVQFIAKEVWQYIFTKPVAAKSFNRKGVYNFEVDDLQLFTPLIQNKDQSINDVTSFEFLLSYITGIIKGCLLSFNIQSLVSSQYRYDVLYTNIRGQNKSDKYPFSFTITILV